MEDAMFETVAMEELQQAGVALRERADAARNREKVLCAAAQLFEEHGIECVSMDDVAAAAGVGKGTLFRRFGDRAGLARAVLDESERAFQDQLLRGDPPLGPGAPPAERIVAFGCGVLDRLETHNQLILTAESGSPQARYQHPVYAAYRAHLYLLLRGAVPEKSAAYLADVLLGSLSAEFFIYTRQIRGLSLDEAKAGFRNLVETLL
jgi:AcrR family transcriptional regulator